MIEVLTAEDVKRQDAACEARGIPTETLMESAGFGVARGARRLLGGTYGRRVVVVCGKGNNAGDGLVAGRVLAGWGAHATAVLLAGDALTGAAATNLERFRSAGRVVGNEALQRELTRADLVVDAIFGVGLSRPPEGVFAEAIATIGSAAAPVLAVDVPSGVDSDTGRLVGDSAVRARATVTFSGLKPGLMFTPGASFAGVVEVHDIGIPSDLRGTRIHALEESDARDLLPRRSPGSHKRSVGTVLVVAGSRAMPGAAALTTAACVHGGAGLTTLAAPESVCQAVIARVPEITTIPIPESGEGTFDEKGLEAIRSRLNSFHALAVGPGITTHPATVDAVRMLVAEATLPVVIDADGLNAFAGATGALKERRHPTIVTPHTGELSRLIDRPASEIDADRLNAVRTAVHSLNAVVLLKGQGTVISSPGGETWINPTGTEALAQGGTGDVLTGLTAAFVAQRPRDELVIPLAAWIHGRAGELVAQRVAPHPANASALIDALAEVIHSLA